MSKLKVALGIVAGVVAICIFATPYITVHQMKSAAASHDGEALAAYIEFPSVRQSLKDQMNAMFAKKMAEDEEMQANPFAALAMAYSGVIVDKAVDAYVTPAGITQLMEGEKPQPGAVQPELGQPAQPAPGQAVPDQPATAEAGSKSEPPEREPLAEASMSYESFDRFVVKLKDEDGKEGKFVLSRRGLGWKLTDIIIPVE
jgi:hypothetical protein